MTQSPPLGIALADALAPWREAWRIRRAHPRWAVVWAAPASQYQAFRLSRRHRDAVLAAATPEELTVQIEDAERAEAEALAAKNRLAVTRVEQDEGREEGTHGCARPVLPPTPPPLARSPSLTSSGARS